MIEKNEFIHKINEDETLYTFMGKTATASQEPQSTEDENEGIYKPLEISRREKR